MMQYFTSCVPPSLDGQLLLRMQLGQNLECSLQSSIPDLEWLTEAIASGLIFLTENLQ